MILKSNKVRPRHAAADRAMGDLPAAEGLLLRMGRGLHGAGAPAYRIEEALEAASERLDLSAQFFSTPTSLFAAFGQGEDQRTYLQRVQPGGIDLGRMSDLDELLELAADPEATWDPAGVPPEPPVVRIREQLDRIEAAPPRFGPAALLLAFALASAAAAVFFGGSLADVLGAGLLALSVGLLQRALSTRASARIFEPLAACLAASGAVVMAHLIPGGSLGGDWIVTLGAVIVLVPGLSLTVGLSELAAAHWMSGTARLAGAATTFLSLGLGLALGRRLGDGLVASGWLGAGSPRLEGGAPPAVQALGPWVEWLALLVAPLAFAVLFRARRRDFPWILAAGALAYLTTRTASEALGSGLGAFLGALALGLGGNLFAQLLRRPAQVTQVPGLILLVPGSLGFESVAAFLDRDALGGLEQALRMLSVGGALVGGLFMAGALIAPRRSL